MSPRTVFLSKLIGAALHPCRAVHDDSLPPEVEAGFFLRQLHYQELFYVYGAISFVLGVYLTYGGFKSRSH